MRIVRFYDDDGNLKKGVLEGVSGKRVRVLEGDIFSGFEITDKVVEAAGFTAPFEPVQVYAVGMNYRKHAEETGAELPERPEVFMKAVTSVIGSGESILLPKAGPDEVDYEGELAVVIGKAVKNVSRDEAMDAVAGYCCANDVSARDWQWKKQKGQWIRAKSFDTFCPLGPTLVTKDEISDPDNLRLETRLNGRTVQNSTTADMVFKVAEIVSDLSLSVTLTPGTVILTGTPEGVGFTRRPPLFLAPGDIVEVRIEGLGVLENPVEAE